MSSKIKYCSGCRNNFYNGNNDLGVEECCSLKKAKVVWRWRLGWWTQPTSKSAFTKVRTLDCHHSPGNYALCEKLPDHLVGLE